MFMATQNPRWHLKTCMNLTSLGFWHQGRTNYLDGPSDDHPPPSSQMATHTRSFQTSHSEQGDDEDEIFVWGKTKWLPSQFSSFVVKSQPGVSQDCLCSQSFGWDKHQQPREGIAMDYSGYVKTHFLISSFELLDTRSNAGSSRLYCPRAWINAIVYGPGQFYGRWK